MYILDTNIIIYALKNSYQSIIEHFEKTYKEDVYVPFIVLSEIEYGARKSFDYEKTIVPYKKFINTFNMIEFDDKATIEYGKIRSELEKEGKIICFNDLIIASIAKANNATLVTHSVEEFKRVDGLKIEDWTKV